MTSRCSAGVRSSSVFQRASDTVASPSPSRIVLDVPGGCPCFGCGLEKVPLLVPSDARLLVRDHAEPVSALVEEPGGRRFVSHAQWPPFGDFADGLSRLRRGFQPPRPA